MFLESLGIYGWPATDEKLLLAGFLTGDPVLLIGKSGSAKTLVIKVLAQALALKAVTYDASKSMFEDVLGFINPASLKKGCIEYVESPITIWDKEIVFIDELNRAAFEMQSKWLEIIRSRQIMGLPTKVKWVFSAMNPFDYSATNALDDALVSRFSSFIYPPDVLDMCETDAILVTEHVNHDDAPAFEHWGGESIIKKVEYAAVGDQIRELLTKAAKIYQDLLLSEMALNLPKFLSKFSVFAMKESNQAIALDGRRLGFIMRTVLAVRAIDLAISYKYGVATPDFKQEAKLTIESCIPVALSNNSIKKEEVTHIISGCFDMLKSYFDKKHDINMTNLIFELFTTSDLLRKIEILVKNKLPDVVQTKAWESLIKSEDSAVIAFLSIHIEAIKPGTIPQELLSSLAAEFKDVKLNGSFTLEISGEEVDAAEHISKMIDTLSNVNKMIIMDRLSGKSDTLTVNTVNKIFTEGDRLSNFYEQIKNS